MIKPSHLLLAAGLAALAPSLVACVGEEQESDPQFPKSEIGVSDPVEQSVASPSAPGEAPIPIEINPVASAAPPPPPSAPPPSPLAQEIVPGSTTEQEYNEEHAGDVYDVPSDQYADADPSALTDFRGTLDPYGSWVDDPNYGTVWTPSASVVGSDFAPYVSGGHWTYDDVQNWVWVSDYDWGWATFHYGRWAYLGSGWGWVPGREYAGAWVNWREGYGPSSGYLGWAPMPPQWGWRNGASFGYGFAPQAPYVFCSGHDVFNGNVGAHIVTGGQVAQIGSHTRGYASPTVHGSGGASGGANGANGGIAGRGLAHPTVGPPPSSVGISPNQIAHTPLNNRGVMHAQQYAHPSTAQSFGAHGATGAIGVGSGQSGYNGYGQPSRGGLVGYRSHDAVARAPQYQGVPAGQHYFPSHTIGGGPYSGYGSSAHYGSTYAGGRYASPSYGGSVGGGAYGGAHYGGYGGGSAYAGGYRGGVIRGGSYASGNGGGNGSSSSSSTTEDQGAPVVHHGGGGGGGGFRGGGGGFHGGGGGGHGGGGRR